MGSFLARGVCWDALDVRLGLRPELLGAGVISAGAGAFGVGAGGGAALESESKFIIDIGLLMRTGGGGAVADSMLATRECVPLGRAGSYGAVGGRAMVGGNPGCAWFGPTGDDWLGGRCMSGGGWLALLPFM